MLLKRLGYDAVAAEGGREAIDLLTNVRPRLVILDCNMPCVDGLDVLRFIRKEPGLAALPVVIFTADAHDDLREAFERIGVQGWITKASMDWNEIARVARQYAS